MSRPTSRGNPDYLILGHITRDLTASGDRLGGTAVYSSILARRMGARVALFTSGAADLPLEILEGIEVFHQPGEGTTTFKNEYTPTGRVQTLSSRAPDLDLRLLPPDWRQARVVHFAPVAREVPLDAGDQFPAAALAYSLQGWLRTWDGSGRISAAPLPEVAVSRRERAAAFLSIEDLGFQRSALADVLERFPQVLLTLGSQGAEIHRGGSCQAIEPVPAREVDPTGAGDIFAGAFMVAWILQGRTPLQAARLANALASISIRREGAAGVPAEDEIKAVIRDQG